MNTSPRRASLPPFAAVRAFYDHVARGYDLLEETYDDVEAQNAVGRRLRRRMQAVLFRTFRPGDRVLEIGCGTGIEAMALASRGVHVLATDLAPAMVARVRARATERGIEGLETRVMRASDVSHLVDEFGPGSFDGAYSHGGALNMDPRLSAFAKGLATLLRSGARFVSTVVNQVSLFECVFYPLVLNPRKGFRRLGNVVPIPITRHPDHRAYVVPTRFYSPRFFSRVLGPQFRVVRLEGLQIVLPPWNLADYIDRVPPLSRMAEAIEDRIAGKAPFNEWGSLFLMEAERIP